MFPASNPSKTAKETQPNQHSIQHKGKVTKENTEFPRQQMINNNTTEISFFSTERSGNDLMFPPSNPSKTAKETQPSARRYQATPPSTAYLNAAFNSGPVPAPTNLAAVVFLSCSGKIDGGLLEIWLYFIRQFLKLIQTRHVALEKALSKSAPGAARFIPKKQFGGGKD